MDGVDDMGAMWSQKVLVFLGASVAVARAERPALMLVRKRGTKESRYGLEMTHAEVEGETAATGS